MEVDQNLLNFQKTLKNLSNDDIFCKRIIELTKGNEKLLINIMIKELEFIVSYTKIMINSNYGNVIDQDDIEKRYNIKKLIFFLKNRLSIEETLRGGDRIYNLKNYKIKFK